MYIIPGNPCSVRSTRISGRHLRPNRFAARYPPDIAVTIGFLAPRQFINHIIHSAFAFLVAGRGNIGLCLDTFHLWTADTSWDEVAALDPALIVVAHLSDVMPRRGSEWSDADRDVLLGDGILPLQEGIEAIRSTGYDGLWCVESLGAYYWEWDPFVLAQELKQRADRLLRP